MFKRELILLMLVTVFLSSCRAVVGGPDKIVLQNPSGITILPDNRGIFSSGNVYELANQHCASFGKNAVLKNRSGPEGPHTFECK
jgi:hypothetical protein